MSYRAALLRRWSRRDVLAVLVVAAAVAFLTGSGIVGHAASTELAGVAADLESPASVTGHDSPAAAHRASGDDAVVLPLARATRADGRTVMVVGVPPDGRTFGDERPFSLPAAPPPGTVRGPVSSERAVTLEGSAGTIDATTVPRTGADGLPDHWYVGAPSTVQHLGSTGALVVSPDGDGTPVLGVLSFFLVGSRQVLRALGLATAAAGALLAVTVYGATRMTVRDRTLTIRVARATGARPRTILSIFGARAALQTTVGVAAGYAVGVIAPNAAVNAAVFVGQPTTLSLQVTPPLAAVLVPAYGALVVIGTLGGVLAVVPAVRRAPAALAGRHAGSGSPSRVPSWLRTDLLDWRAVVPTATTLGVFVVVAVLVAGTAGVVAPLAGGDGATITEPGATHPFASRVPASYATELRVQGTTASPEILALGVADGQPYVARGANLSAFAAVTDAEVATGRPYRRPGEALVGQDLARTLGIAVGDTLLVGGSTTPAVDRLRIVGSLKAEEPYDDQLLVPLATARHLAGLPPGHVQFVRTAERPGTETPRGIVVLDVEAPGQVTADGTVDVTVTLLNPTSQHRERTVRAALDDEQASERVRLAPNERWTVTLSLPAGQPRRATLTVAGRDQALVIVDPDALRLDVPDRAPPGSEPLVRVRTATGDPVAGATVTADDVTVTTGSDGSARLPLGDAGETRVVATAGDRTANATVTVTGEATRRPLVAVAVSPEDPTPATRPRATVTLSNPWNRTLSQPIAISGPGVASSSTVRLAPGESAAVDATLARRPAGEYEVVVRSEGSRVAGATYEVRGDPRLAAALATSGREGASTGVGRALETVLGNIELVVATVLGLAALMTVGGTTAGFGSAVHARRHTLGIHRAMGASPRQVLALVLADAVRIGAVATVLALALAAVILAALDAAGLLTLYGVRVLSSVDPVLVAGAAVAAVALALVGATLATVGVLRIPPSDLLSGAASRLPNGGASDE